MIRAIITEVQSITQQAPKVENERPYEVGPGSPLLFFAKLVFAAEVLLLTEATKTVFVWFCRSIKPQKTLRTSL